MNWGPNGPQNHHHAAPPQGAWAPQPPYAPRQPHPSQPPHASYPPQHTQPYPTQPRAGAWNHACPKCGSNSISKPGFTWWGGLLGPRLLDHRVCNQCRHGFNGRTGYGSTLGIVLYTLAMTGLFLHAAVWIVGTESVGAHVLELPLYVATSVVLIGGAVVAKRARPDAWGVLLAAGLIKLVDALLHWTIGLGISLLNGYERHVMIEASRVLSEFTGVADVIAISLLAVALLRLARPAVFERR